MKIIIAGGRKFDNYTFLREKCDEVISQLNTNDITIVSGTAKGTDKLGEKYAEERNYNIQRMPAPWNDIKGKPPFAIKYRRDGSAYWTRAGYYRNEQMAKVSNILIAFWDGKSAGTRHMINMGKKYNLEVHVFKYIYVKQ